MSSENPFAERPDFCTGGEERSSFEAYISEFQGEKPAKEYAYGPAYHDLVETARGAADARFLFLDRASVFQDPATEGHAYKALCTDLADMRGFWIPVVCSIIEKPDKDLLDYAFLGTFSSAMRSGESKYKDVGVPEVWSDIAHVRRDLLRGSRLIVGFLDFELTSSAGLHETNEVYFWTIEGLLGDQLSEADRGYLRRLLATDAIRSFVATGEESSSLFPLYHSIYGSRENAIDIASRDFQKWMAVIPTAVDRLSGRDDAARNLLRDMIAEKLVRDLSIELPRIEQEVGEGRIYDALLRYQAAVLLDRLGYTWPESRAIFERIPGFVDFPGKEQSVLSTSSVGEERYLRRRFEEEPQGI
ncbi:hypothetical protein JW710_01675 [Candidatus Dojkabacteria bacterium]|nr:hypothetical protein [Candidatus Dojkabacteria bacterium]